MRKGYIPEEDIGQPLRFGDADAMIAMVQKMAYREGFGDTLAMGSYRMAAKYGHPETRRHGSQAGVPRLRPARLAGYGAAVRHIQ